MWEVVCEGQFGWWLVQREGEVKDIARCHRQVDAQRIADLLNAEEIQLRRRLSAICVKGYFVGVLSAKESSSYCVPDVYPNKMAQPFFPDPTTALIEADKWLREHETTK